MGLSGNRRVAHALVSELRSCAMFLSSAIACLDAAQGVADATGEADVPWDMGLGVGRMVHRFSDPIRPALVERMGQVEAMIDVVDEYISTLGS